MNRAREVLITVTERMEATKADPVDHAPTQGPNRYKARAGQMHVLELRDPDSSIMMGLSISEADTKNAVVDTLVADRENGKYPAK